MNVPLLNKKAISCAMVLFHMLNAAPAAKAAETLSIQRGPQPAQVSSGAFQPGVYVQETAAKQITGVETSTAAFIGSADRGPFLKPVLVKSFQEFTSLFGGPDPRTNPFLARAVRSYFANGGRQAYIVRVTGSDYTAGLSVLENTAGINLVAAPGLTDLPTHLLILSHCEKMRFRFAILDAPLGADPSSLQAHARGLVSKGRWGALYHPWVRSVDPGSGTAVDMAPSGAAAGVFARTDAQYGVWKAPAGLSMPLAGISGLSADLSQAELGNLNMAGINCLRFVNSGYYIWGAHTLDYPAASEWRYIPVRRQALFIEESLRQGLQWTMFEPDDEPLWARIRQAAENFLLDHYRKGALQGNTPASAFFVACDRTTTLPGDRAAGKVNLIVGIAPVRPAEFILIRMQLRALPLTPSP